jgi:nucleoside-diphosphate-sugar epimerase
VTAGHDQVLAVCRSPRGGWPSGVEEVVVDLTAPRFTDRLPARVAAVFHLAQSHRFRDFPAGATDVEGVNVAATVALATWARNAGAGHFVYASTGAVYGTGAKPFREDDALPDEPRDFYVASKRAGELLIAPFAAELCVVTIRPFFVYGPDGPADRLLPRLVSGQRAGEAATLDGPDGFRLNPIHVDDAVAACVRCLALSRSTTVNVAGAETVTLRALVVAIAAALGVDPIFRPGGATAADLVGDIRRMETLLHRPTRSLVDGMSELASTVPT